MANPIIKIKRGNGEPTAWNGSSGITAGEFAFDRTTGMLYLGVTGQYLQQNFQGLCALNGPFVIPVGAQISNDSEFGSGGELGNLGYSDYTIPTTKAVREYVLTQKAAAAFGFTLQAGNGISFAYPTEDVLRIDNVGALQALAQIQLQAQNGGVVTGTTQQTPIGSTFGILKFLPQSGIKIGNTISNGTASVTIENIGVTGINGATGNITSFLPVQSLAGYTSAINNIAFETFQVEGSYPIQAVKIAEVPIIDGITAAILQVSHGVPLTSTQSGDFSVGGFANGYMYVPAITFDAMGHAKYVKGITLFDGFIPVGLTEAVQDIVGDSSFTRAGLGMSIAYNDSSNTHTFTNTGIRGFTAGNTSISNGIVTIAAANGSNITVTGSNSDPKTITIDQNIPYFKNFTLAGNVDTAGSISADEADDTLTINAGTGISFASAYSNDTFTITNNGVLTVNNAKGNITIEEGTGVQVSTVGNAITISAAGGGDGNIGSINGEFELNGNDSATGVTGFVSIEGITQGFAIHNYIAPSYQKNIVTFRSDEDQNGKIFIDLASSIVLPVDASGSNLSSITIPPSGADGIRPGNSVLRSDTQDWSDNALITPAIRAGATGAAIIDGDGTPSSSGAAAGKELILHAESGTFGQGLAPTNWDAMVVISAYPTNHTIGDALTNFGFVVGNCDNGTCVGFPPVLLDCDGSAFDGTTEVASGSVSILANALIDGALVVKDDIFLAGDLYGNNGCKINLSDAAAASNYFDACGTLRNPGGIYLNGSDCDADSNRAIFNVDEFFIKDRLVTIGGASGNVGPLPNNGLFGTTMDVGFLMPSYLNGQERTAFIGIDTSDGSVGTFKFIPTASLTQTSSGRFVDGNVGPAKFDTLNGVGLSGGNTVSIINSANSVVSNDSNRLVIRDRNTSGSANISFKGAGNITFSTGGNISLAQNAAITIGTAGGRINQQILGTGILDFTSSLQGLTFSAASNQLTIVKRTSNNTGTYLFPTVTNDTSIIVDTDSTQTLTDKTLGADCVIDCGSY